VKKFATLLFAFCAFAFLSIGLTGCSNSGTPKKTETKTETKTDTNAPGGEKKETKTETKTTPK
jgi:hypothetical protein